MTATFTDLVVLLLGTAVVAAAGAAVGILVAPAATRWAERDDEESSDRDG